MAGPEGDRAPGAGEVLDGLGGVVEVQRASVYHYVANRGAERCARVDRHSAERERECATVAVSAGECQSARAAGLVHSQAASRDSPAISRGGGAGDSKRTAADHVS